MFSYQTVRMEFPLQFSLLTKGKWLNINTHLNLIRLLLTMRHYNKTVPCNPRSISQSFHAESICSRRVAGSSFIKPKWSVYCVDTRTCAAADEVLKYFGRSVARKDEWCARRRYVTFGSAVYAWNPRGKLQEKTSRLQGKRRVREDGKSHVQVSRMRGGCLN